MEFLLLPFIANIARMEGSSNLELFSNYDQETDREREPHKSSEKKKILSLKMFPFLSPKFRTITDELSFTVKFH